MKKMTMLAGPALLACLWAHPMIATAQSGKVLKGRELNEAALVEALVPEPAERTRSIRVQGAGSSGGKSGGDTAAKPASASVLITFETDSTEIQARSKQSLDVIGRALKSDRLADFKFAVEGHADPRGGSEYNLRLSQARAETIVDYLVRNHGIDATRLKPIGRGDSELLNPKAPTAPENRRVTIKTVLE